MINHSILFVLSCVLLSCSPFCGRTPQAPEVPCDWKAPYAPVVETSPTPEWWKAFNDENLNSLENYAISASPTLDEAEARLQEAWAIAKSAKAALFPLITLNPNFTHIGENTNSIPLPFSVQSLPPRVQQKLYQIPISGTFEVDIWGRNLSIYETQAALAHARAWDYQNTWLTLTANVASSYFQLRALDTAVEVLENVSKFLKEAYEINLERYETGLVNYSDVSSSQVEYENSLNLLEDYRRQRALAENLLATYTAQPASNFTWCRNILEQLPPEFPATTPCSVLVQRPDIQATEWLIRSASAQITSAELAWFPSLTLSGQIGFQAGIMADLLDWQSRLWSYTTQIVQTLFDGGRINADIEVAKATYLQRNAEYRNTVLLAVQQVEDALANIQGHRQQEIHLQKTIEAAKTNLQLSTERYNTGLTNYIEVVNAQRNVLNSELNYALVLGAHYIDNVSLAAALGGQW